MLDRAVSRSDAARLFLLFRMLVQLTIAPEHAHEFRVRAPSVLSALASAIARCEPFIADDAPEPVPAYLTEALAALFSLTACLGPFAPGGQRASPTRRDVECYCAVIPAFDRALHTRSAAHAALRHAVLSCLINSPRGWPSLIPRAVLDNSVAYFLAAADKHLADTEGCPRPETLIPLLLLLLGVLDELPEVRAAIFDAVFPAGYRAEAAMAGEVSVEGPPAVRTSPVLGARLARIMTTTNIALKHVVQEFMYTVCNRDPNLLCSLTGVGYAAGLLQAHSLWGVPK
jgi:hypothetical protein